MLFAMTIDWMNVGGIAAIALAAFAPSVYEKVKKYLPRPTPVSPAPVGPTPVVPIGGGSAQADACCLAANALVAELLKAKKYDLAKDATELAKRVGGEKPITEAKPKTVKVADPGEDYDPT